MEAEDEIEYRKSPTDHAQVFDFAEVQNSHRNFKSSLRFDPHILAQAKDNFIRNRLGMRARINRQTNRQFEH